MAEEPINNAAPAATAAPAPAAPSTSNAPAADNSTAVTPNSETPASSENSVSSPSTTSFLNGSVTQTEGAGATQPTEAAKTETNTDASPAPTPVADKAPAPAETKPAEQNKAPETDKKPEAQPNDGNKSEEPAPLPVFEPWTLPENVKLDDKESGEFNKLLGELQNTTKAEQAVFQKFGQTLVDKHVSAVTETVNRVHSAYNTAWQKQTDGWRESFVNDPEIGGKRQETTIRLANEFIDTHGGSAENKAAFRKVMEQTGLGVHPEVLRLLSNAMNRFREGRPLPANPPSNPAMSKTQKWYGKKSG